MVVNADLATLLDQTVTRFRPTETTSKMVTTAAFAASTGMAAHVQPVSPSELARAMGYETRGSYEGWFNSTADLAVGDLLKVTSTGSMTGLKFWVRGAPDDTDVAGLEHQMLALDLTTEST